MKNTLKVSLGFALMLLGLSSYGATLTVWEDLNKTNGIRDFADQFEKKYGVKVDIQGKDSANHVYDVADLISRGEKTPDIFLIVSDRVGDAMSKGILAPIENMEQEKSHYIETATELFKVKGKYYGVPRSIEALIVYYNKDVMPVPYETLNEYIEFTDKHKAQGIYGLISKVDNFYYSYGFFGAYGSYVFKQNSEGEFNPYNIGLDNDKAVKGVSVLADFAKKHVPMSVLGQEGWANIDEMFKSGKVGAIINGPWTLDGYASSGINYGVAPLPKLPDGTPMRPFFGVKSYAISSTSENKKLAEEFIKFINQTEFALKRYHRIAELPPIKELLSKEEITNDDYASAIAAQVEYADPMPTIPQMAHVWVPMEETLYSIIKNNEPIEAALDLGVMKIKQKIAEN
ncbi:sugar ABC transporter substrate-binding protein [Succinivibrio dextrinosolvens]|uniref:Maltodextrin-binding protein n=1 Tax=Succinivibrio dextrinosolvens TaxID=83771 RepID=A0A662ZAI5_9GAMM|nr:extracellular solute-binding protein [Succinivibrio dextrinosolvens]SFK22409.1 arabinogalactan oligomer / maltooligosaccharide transport system substrate-binding protein [Succinivibrio dextrinosolvens]